MNWWSSESNAKKCKIGIGKIITCLGTNYFNGTLQCKIVGEETYSIAFGKFSLYHAQSSAILCQVIFSLEFQKFEKSDAINLSSGFDGRLTRMIKKWWYGETLLGGKPEHIYIIEKELISLSSHFPSSACVKYMNDHSNFDVSFAEHNLPLWRSCLANDATYCILYSSQRGITAE